MTNFFFAERKVSTLDDYGDENWGALDTEISRCIEKIANAERGASSGYSKRNVAARPTRVSDYRSDYLDVFLSSQPIMRIEQPDQYDEHALYSELFYSLEGRFRSYHSQQPSSECTAEQISRMTGVEFENYLMRTLKQHGCTVSGTPKTGDKGADMIARFSDRIIIIQAKRSSAPVGNRAVQEVVAALAYYRGTEAWVMTNSTFTEAARELAQSNKVRLLCGADLPRMAQFIAPPNI